ncbi:trehalose-phosphatase [Phakopsora pachyrhizi]|nr:trehalose-phosphatase [Phakopsora pachyrhizi]
MYDRTQIHYGLAQSRPDEDDWEPPQLEGMPELPDIRHRVKLTGHVIMACHTLPYVCNLHPDTSSEQSSAQSYGGETVNPRATSPPPSSNSLGIQTSPTGPSRRPSAYQPIEIRPGDQVTKPQGLYSPTPVGLTTSGAIPSLVPQEQSLPDANSALRLNLNSSRSTSILDAPKTVSRPSTPSRPNQSSTSGLRSPRPLSQPEPESPAPRFRWVLEPRRGHAALNAGIKSLASWRSVTLCAYPADIRIINNHSSTSEHLDPSKVTRAQKHALDGGWGDQNYSDPQSKKKGIECVPVWLDDRSAGLHYEGFCKKYLWPILHYMPLSEHQDKASENMAWEAYKEVNLAFAQQIANIYQPGDLIWIQDYHLLLVPRMLRRIIPECHIGLFLHSPFPSSEFFRCLPRREEILDGMLGADLLCFQTYSYGRHFVSACIRVKGCESVGGGIETNGRIAAVTHCPIGIDADRIEIDRKLPGVKPKMDALKKLYEGKKIIIGRDKLDPTKGVIHKLKAFEALLKNFPHWRNQAVLIQVTSPSPTDSPQLATKISELVDHINATYGTLQFQPVHHYHQTIEQDEYFALLSVADLAVITSVRDGMNTTSMEYTICQKEFQNPLILSEFTGVTGSMKSAVKVNPWDLGGVAKAIDQCLSMTDAEKLQRHKQLYTRVKLHSSAVWASTLILQLLHCMRGDQTMESVKLLKEQEMFKKYVAADKRLLLFDYDGTLTPIVKNPKDAVPPEGLIEALERLCADERNIVYIISGRDGQFLQKHLGSIANLGMSAEHGCFLREPGAKEWVDLTENIDMSWMNDVEEIFKYYEARTLGAFVEKKISSVTWHYRNADPEFGLFQAKECQALLESMQERMPIDILKGKKNIECRPAHTNKGEIVKRLLYTTPEIGFALCVGDDKTDEDMFRALKMLRSSASLEGHAGQVHHPTTIDPPQTLALYPILARSSSNGPAPRSPVESPHSLERSRGPSKRRYSSNTSMRSAASGPGSPANIGASLANSSNGLGTAVTSATPPSNPQNSPKFEPVQSVLEPESIFSIVIDENESRKTLAEYRLNRPLDLVAVLQRLSKI